MTNDWHIQRSKGFLDALIDIGRDLKASDAIDLTAFDNDGSRRAIIACVEARIGKPSDSGDLETTPIGYQQYFNTHSNERWAEGRLAGYTHTLRSLCYLDCGGGSGRALIEIGSWFEEYYGVENTIDDGGMESLVDMIHDKFGSTFENQDEAYDYGYINMFRLIENLAYMNGF